MKREIAFSKHVNREMAVCYFSVKCDSYSSFTTLHKINDVFRVPPCPLQSRFMVFARLKYYGPMDTWCSCITLIRQPIYMYTVIVRYSIVANTSLFEAIIVCFLCRDLLSIYLKYSTLNNMAMLVYKNLSVAYGFFGSTYIDTIHFYNTYT